MQEELVKETKDVVENKEVSNKQDVKSKKKWSYDQLMSNTEKPVSERKTIISARSNNVMPRRHHLTEEAMETCRSKFEKEIKDVPTELREKAGDTFFNPMNHRKSIYYNLIQSLYMLGCNEWHEFPDVKNKCKELMSKIIAKGNMTAWDKFERKSASRNEGKAVTSAKDANGRIRDNFRTLQRLGGAHPYGYKLKQVLSSIDIRRNNEGILEYRLRTDYNSMDEVSPLLATKIKNTDIKIPEKFSKDKEDKKAQVEIEEV